MEATATGLDVDWQLEFGGFSAGCLLFS